LTNDQLTQFQNDCGSATSSGITDPSRTWEVEWKATGKVNGMDQEASFNLEKKLEMKCGTENVVYEDECETYNPLS